jgi:hypothetical protein
MSIETRELSAETWGKYFESIAPDIEGLLVTVFDSERFWQVLELGDQTDVERMPLQTIGYDHKDDVFEVAVGGRGTRYPVVLRHFIYNPKTIGLEEAGPPTPSAILVTDADGVRTLIRLLEPTVLEP